MWGPSSTHTQMYNTGIIWPPLWPIGQGYGPQAPYLYSMDPLFLSKHGSHWALVWCVASTIPTRDLHACSFQHQRYGRASAGIDVLESSSTSYDYEISDSVGTYRLSKDNIVLVWLGLPISWFVGKGSTSWMTSTSITTLLSAADINSYITSLLSTVDNNSYIPTLLSTVDNNSYISTLFSTVDSSIYITSIAIYCRQQFFSHCFLL